MAAEVGGSLRDRWAGGLAGGVGRKEASVNRAKLRVALHELVRVWVGRQDDWELLGSVEQGELKVSVAAAEQLLEECELREESRRGREQGLLQDLQALGDGYSLLGCIPQELGELEAWRVGAVLLGLLLLEFVCL